MNAPMTWSTYSGADLTGWLVSEKLDGVRALWDGVQLTTQTAYPIAAPAWFTAGLPAMRLDGELYAGPGTLPRVQGLARRHTPGDWSGLEFHLFDAPAIAGGFAARLQSLQWLAGILPAHVYIVPHQVCPSHDWLAARFADVVASGGEGLVARHPSGQYRAGQRDAHVVKIKQHPDTVFLLTHSGEEIYV